MTSVQPRPKADQRRFAPFPLYWQPNRELWRYFIVNSELFGCEWRGSVADDAYEQVIVRKDKNPGYQGFFYTFPDAKEYSTKDLYRPHPTLPDHWVYYGRADNIIVFSNGEKLNPASIETIMMRHPAFSSRWNTPRARIPRSLSTVSCRQ
jgi:hypothetical protein